MRKNVLITIKL